MQLYFITYNIHCKSNKNAFGTIVKLSILQITCYANFLEFVFHNKKNK